MTTLSKVTAYVDGSCQPNPGPGGVGIVLRYGEVVKDFSFPLRADLLKQPMTNNRAEILAVVRVFELLKRRCDVTIYSDSQLVVMCARREWKRKANLDLWEIFDREAAKHQWTIEWVRGHVGNPDNERAHNLAYEAIKRVRS